MPDPWTRTRPVRETESSSIWLEVEFKSNLEISPQKTIGTQGDQEVEV